MRFNAAVTTVLCSSAVLIGSVAAQDAAAEPASDTVAKPNFTVSLTFASHLDPAVEITILQCMLTTPIAYVAKSAIPGTVH